MENLIKGWVTSVIGVIIMIGVILHAFGIYTFPNPGMLNTLTECIIAFLVGFAMFFLPRTKLEAIVEKIVDKKTDQL